MDVALSCIVPDEAGVLTIGFDEDGRAPDVGEGVARGDDEVVTAFIRGGVAEEDVGADYIKVAGVVADAVGFVSWKRFGE